MITLQIMYTYMISCMYTCFYKTGPQAEGRVRNGSELIFFDSLALIGLQSIGNYFTMYIDFV